ncbi:glycosyltransferase family 62 protein [Annulohypoxylon maeteangense]|uniref:glycosyltransferase family 62 protein n=1 Tax=Annulohypoxylon maeteangense TaxID=1927788 RepID=UPI00200729F1|nr:glycosyltransferase family 62 protein [Annulohypoxylon maeteangense]KAI0883998.1 glycosyltransferase family 62 protein [Annulohypoxylon maeteangense]
MANRMRFAPNRVVLFSIAAALGLFVLFHSFEPRKRAWSCKTLSSCLGGNHPPTYKHWDGVPLDLAVGKNEKTLSDGTVLYHQHIVNTNPDILFLVLTRDGHSWSRDFRSTRRTVYDFIDMLVSTDLDLTRVSLGLMTSSREEFEATKKAVMPLPFARVALFYREGDGGGAASRIPYEDRHKAEYQRLRRGAIASARNYLMARSLQDESHVIWVDADIVEFSPGVIQKMIGHAETRDDVGIVTAICVQTITPNYDKNAWTVNRQVPLLMGPVGDGDLDTAADKLVETRTYLDELIKGTSDDDLLPVDSVGGTILYIKASIVRQGINFPTSLVVGTTWSHEGWVGIESEGICYMTSHLDGGGGCFVLGGSHFVRHADWS